MSFAVGFLTNAGSVSAIGTSYAAGKAIALTSISTVDGAENDLPQGAYLDHLELRVTPTGATTLTCFLAWDAAGDFPATAEGTLTLITGVTTATVAGGACVIDGWFRPPGKTLTLYLFVKTNAGTVDVAANAARVHWTEAFASRG